jgi:hypothetical protein
MAYAEAWLNLELHTRPRFRPVSLSLYMINLIFFQVNITLMAMPVFGNESNDMDINFNEK